MIQAFDQIMQTNSDLGLSMDMTYILIVKGGNPSCPAIMHVKSYSTTVPTCS